MQEPATHKSTEEMMKEIRKLRERIERFGQDMKEEREALRKEMQDQRVEFDQARVARRDSK